MGRADSSERLEPRVRSIRLAKGLAQGILAQRVGLTRQALGAIESGQSVPNTVVSLRLARALDCRVEDLFDLGRADGAEAIEIAGPAAEPAPRLTLARIRGRWIGYPLGADRLLQEGFVSADGLRDSDAAGGTHLLAPREVLERTALLLGCDPSLGILSSHLAQWRSEGRVHWLAAASRPALDAVARGEAHLAGSHLRDRASGTYNVVQARDALGEVGGLVVAFARWEQGFVVAPGNPLGIRSAADLARPEIRLVNRDVGAGSRALLDDLLREAGVPVALVSGYGHTVSSHLAVARAVASGASDVGIALEAVARALALDFLPVTTVQFDLVIPRDHLAHPSIALLLDQLQSRALRSDLRALPGYDVSRLGTVVADLPTSACADLA